MKKFIMYGAGNIGRGFIGQLFSLSGYSVGFIDINKEVIGRLNSDKEYPVDVVSNEGLEEIMVKNVYGIDGTDIELVSDEIASADIMATAIGVNVLKFIAKPIALGLKKRFEKNAKPFNIIICENLIGADEFLKGLIKEQIPEYAEKVENEVGFVEASIGRMVPVMTEEKKQGNPLRVYVEPYNILPVDLNAFKGEVPSDVQNLYPYKPFNMFIQRKLFMHNMSHATCAYLGYLRNYEFIYQAAEDFDIKYVAYKSLIQSALAISKENGVEIEMLISHAENLLYRFLNKALGDTVARVGKDTIRKLSSNDRLVGALKLCEKHNVPNEYICIGIATALVFDPDGDDSSKEVCAYAKEFGVKATLEKYCQYTGEKVALIEELYEMIKNGKQISALVKVCEEAGGKQIRV
ncbi:MAG: mannitol dehydrogenase [Clostridiales bacterium]|nr:mannitol dehydrogenase [Clostridiales bacterium]